MLGEQLKTKLKVSRKRGAAEQDAPPGQSGKKKHAGASRVADAAAAEPANASIRHTPLCTVLAASGQESYVNDLAWGGGDAHPGMLLAAGLSSGAVALFQATPTELRLATSNDAHAAPVRQLRFSRQTHSLLHSCGGDGAVVGWDCRSSRLAHRLAVEGAALNTCDAEGHLVAAGANGRVLFWDLRKGSASDSDGLLADFEDTHEQEVTKVAFHPERQRFLSASEDGLIAVFDLTGGLDEDDSFQGAVNLMDSVADFGFFGRSRELLWARTFTEAFYAWEWAAACEEDSEGGAGPLAAVRDAREQLSDRAKAALPGSSMEYLVGCTYSPEADRLSLVAGTAGGDVAVFPVRLAEGKKRFGKPSAVLSGGHTSVVRSQVWPDQGTPSLLTGGEDGRIAAWQL